MWLFILQCWDLAYRGIVNRVLVCASFFFKNDRNRNPRYLTLKWLAKRGLSIRSLYSFFLTIFNCLQGCNNSMIESEIQGKQRKYTLAPHNFNDQTTFHEMWHSFAPQACQRGGKILNFELITQMVSEISTCEKSQFCIVLKSHLTMQGLPSLFNIQQSPLLCFVSQ